MGFASKTTENTDFLFSKKEPNQKIERKQRNLPKIMLGISRKFKERCLRKREHSPLLVQLVPPNFGLSCYPFACQ